MSEIYDKLNRCYESVKDRIGFVPKVALVLGSGLGDYGNEIDVSATLPYNEINGFPISTVPGHKGQFIFGYVGDVPVVCMQGRVHYYEGYPISDVVLPTRLMKMMGAQILFLTNASGGINTDFKAGDFMLITDHISCFAPNPLVGQNIDKLGVRFPDMSKVYDEKLCEVIRESAADLGIRLMEGVYAQLTGPSFESPAEIRMLKSLGVDAVGMSTVVEAIAANHCGMKICGISCVCNLAAGLSPNPLTHEEVQAAANEAAPLFKKLVTESICRFGVM
ncbi:MAG: purine-nucleoside phosphorylase [Lachnospiraceae bacterium]|nr:purine-nucleoside phosphorylase [Lachnospiraceae bacterium]MBR6486174.1 purine-nucleoside phosphorylase [Lachnospiraceae bacterium]